MCGLDIRDGDVVAVDTASLRAAAARYTTLERDLADVVTGLDAGAWRLTTSPAGAGMSVLVQRCARDVAARADDARALSARLMQIAAFYEMVELSAQERIAAAGGDGARVRLIERRLAQLSARNPGLRARAEAAMGARRASVGLGVGGPANAGALPPILQPAVLLTAVAAQAAVRLFAHGTVYPGRATPAPAPAVRVRRVRHMTAVPPSGVAGALARIPGDDARVRVETYTLPDASRRYAVYIAGTRDFGHWFGDHDDPADMQSNLQLYAGRAAAAYETAREALADAGVPAGADVYVFGHSQGGMIANLLAVQGTYRTRMLVTAGSPTAAAVGDETLSIQLRHTDDLVQSLAGAGPVARTGAPGSVVVQRTADPRPALGDAKLASHHLFRYVATARLVDASPDPRAAAMRDRLAELRDAVGVTAVEYDGTRVRPLLGERAPARRRPLVREPPTVGVRSAVGERPAVEEPAAGERPAAGEPSRAPARRLPEAAPR